MRTFIFRKASAVSLFKLIVSPLSKVNIALAAPGNMGWVISTDLSEEWS
jgi:hypothetical protein